MNVYLDYQATTPVDERVLETMLPFFSEVYGNAASTNHEPGRNAMRATAAARAQVADLIGADPLSIVFTSGATESINLALKGLAEYGGDKRRHFISCRSEHPAVLDTCSWLEKKGFRGTWLKVDAEGHLDLDQLREAISEDTLFISLMFANNEIGTIHDIAAIGAIAKEKGVFFHCDGAQAVGNEWIDVDSLGIDLLSISGHKLYAPKGVGALYIRRRNPRVRLAPQIHGGGHERSYRSGTLNVPGIVGLGKACELAAMHMDEESERLKRFRSMFLEKISCAGVDFRINGDMERRLAGNLNIRFPGVSAAQMLEALPELSMSRGSACSSAVSSPSRVLLGLGLSPAEVSESIRLSFGRPTTTEEVIYAADKIAIVARTLATLGGTNTEESCHL